MMKDKKTEAYELFLKALQKTSLQNLAEMLYELLGFKVMICDDLWMAKVFAPRKDLKKSREEDIRMNQQVTDTMFTEFLKRYVDNTKRDAYPVLVENEEIIAARQLFSPLFMNDCVVGYAFLALAEEDEISEEDREIIQIFNTFAAAILLSVKENMNRGAAKSSHMLNYLLSVDDTKSEGYKMGVRRLSVRYKPPYCGILITAQDDQEDSVSAVGVFKVIGNFASTLLYTDIESSMFLLLSDFKQENLQSIIRQLQQYLKGDVHISTSVPFETLANVRDYYKQAKLTMKIGLRQGRTRFWYRSDLFMPLQMYEQFVENESIVPYLHPKLMEILDYDKKNNTEYLATLAVYVFTFMNIKDSAKLMCVHVNTIHYRVKKLEEHFKIDFSDYYLMNVITSNVGILMATDQAPSYYIRKNYFEPYLDVH